ncbi:unnamed protein product [Pleuronectes platessa]|uniref:Uncharacterized protein n=1 Tax=Pleuronectes platessa TaxID=8262 RepID=A0A9N7VSL9_PLEPL|nr:unnamed protein product [Pleuronectes platessa]
MSRTNRSPNHRHQATSLVPASHSRENVPCRVSSLGELIHDFLSSVITYQLMRALGECVWRGTSASSIGNAPPRKALLALLEAENKEMPQRQILFEEGHPGVGLSLRDMYSHLGPAITLLPCASLKHENPAAYLFPEHVQLEALLLPLAQDCFWAQRAEKKTPRFKTVEGRNQSLSPP